MRLQKFLADCGAASRRAGEKLILDGRVEVNGQVITELGTQVDPNQDEVRLNGKTIRSRKKLYVALHKPKGYLCTQRDPQNRKTVGELLPKEWSNLYPVGRLDGETEGLLLLTNDGDFCLRVTHPRFGMQKTYQATAEGRIDPVQVRLFTQGIDDKGEHLQANAARIISISKRQSIVELVLSEGKNREIRRLFTAANLKLIRLKRVRIGRLELGNLAAGKWRVLSPAEIRSLFRQETAHSSRLIDNH